MTARTQAYIGDEIAPSRSRLPLCEKERAVKKRRRFKQTSSLADRLMENVEQLRQQMAQLPPGLKRELLERRIRQSETASHIDEWVRSPGLQPPVQIANMKDRHK